MPIPSSRLILSASALLLAGLGLAALFAPGDSAMVLGFDARAAEALALVAPGLLGMAGLNWVGRGVRLDGLYGRPLSVANFLTGGVGASTLARLETEMPGDPAGWVLVGLLALYTLLFAWYLFAPPDTDPTAP